MIEIRPDLHLDEDEIEISFVRASGPGGQNVNKVSTAAQLRFDARRSPSLPDAVAARLIGIAGARATNDGVIVLTADRFRSQERNRADAIARLVAMIVKAATPPKPRRKTAPPRAAKEERLKEKASRGRVKSERRRPIADD